MIKNQTIEAILDIYEEFKMPTSPIDEWDKGGRQKMGERLLGFVVAGQTIRFSLLGYPFKSLNDRDKVLGRLPDLGEKVSIDNFNTFAGRIGSVYSPGAAFSIISDGYAFSDVLGASNREVTQYADIVRDMAHDAPIDLYDIYSFYPRHMTLEQMREKLMSDFGVSDEELERRILMDADVNALYRGMVRFMNEELAVKEFPSRNQLQKAAKILTREMMRRNEAYSALIRSEFADHIRLSMHPSTNNGTKYSFQLVPSPNAIHSPWHSALVIHNNGDLETMHKKDAIEAGYELVYENNQPFYFTEK